MGATQDPAVAVEEGKSLLEKPFVNGVPVSAAPKVAPRRWRNHWLAIFGDCSPVDVSACCLAYHAPCVAWGWNQSRAFQMTFWKEAVRFILLTVGIFGAIHAACCVMMMVACPPPPPGDMPQMMGSMGDGPHHMHGMHDHHMHDGPHHMHEDRPELTPECAKRVAPGLVALAALAIAAFVYVVMFAARRRRAIRERFGIEGSFKQDVALWACCSLCALTQETRTLMHEQVHDGLWYGPVPTQQAGAPVAQTMQV
mmetsp:Transcript_11645/g.24982  ORF Transcript_11645/g.24982 Transcript_11645/m.24982 type:complete len:254 (-) Transcript_11645:588-1349(-)|eukprot:CAMPEP_0202900568 /NCGR_PEP_ID=MMETSP1392-20130828/11908_1 /ASSEMBLY_ACC=CAM_ASM_000868 /TAXON_ID=225041 /ORGANISM="Chlamydomonas chlamydogama, Strain SAG 11-48b" /LENGTH=253 /DNA_ID=CAMNT_0049586983 /DNA_START=116 /DNA_END=877 /DNA_ORIENTATION=+